MRIGPKYKIARRLGVPVFEKTQTQKYVLSEERKTKNKRPRQKTDFGLQLLEKQKARMFYGITERQFKKYVNRALAQKAHSPASDLLTTLESRLDNCIWRSGLAPTHSAARQMVSHGHICVNGKKTKVPSFNVSAGDIVSIREGSKKGLLFNIFMEKGPEKELPSWLSFDSVKKEILVKAKPTEAGRELYFNLGQVIGFYQR